MTFLDRWTEQLDIFMEYILIALTAGVLVACFSAKVRVRFLIGSIVFGCVCGGIAQALSTSDAIPVAATILGVLTAPMTVAKLSGMTLWEAVDEIRARVDKRAAKRDDRDFDDNPRSRRHDEPYSGQPRGYDRPYSRHDDHYDPEDKS